MQCGRIIIADCRILCLLGSFFDVARPSAGEVPFSGGHTSQASPSLSSSIQDNVNGFCGAIKGRMPGQRIEAAQEYLRLRVSLMSVLFREKHLRRASV